MTESLRRVYALSAARKCGYWPPEPVKSTGATPIRQLEPARRCLHQVRHADQPAARALFDYRHPCEARGPSPGASAPRRSGSPRSVPAPRPAGRSRRCRRPNRRRRRHGRAGSWAAGRRAATSVNHLVQRQRALAEPETARPVRRQQPFGLGRNVPDHRHRQSTDVDHRYGAIQPGRVPCDAVHHVGRQPRMGVVRSGACRSASAPQSKS